MHLMVHHEVCEDADVVHVEGEVDIDVADELSSQLKAGLDTASTLRGRLLLIDLQDVGFFGVAGLRALLRCRDEGAANGVVVRLVTANPMVDRVLEVTGLDEILTPYPTLDEALRRAGH